MPAVQSQKRSTPEDLPDLHGGSGLKKRIQGVKDFRRAASSAEWIQVKYSESKHWNHRTQF
jgi:hypothetical protein